MPIVQNVKRLALESLRNQIFVLKNLHNGNKVEDIKTFNQNKFRDHVQIPGVKHWRSTGVSPVLH